MVSIRTVSMNSSTTLHSVAYLAFTVHGRHISQQLNGTACRIGRGDQNTIALSGAYSADDAAKDVRAINSRIDSTSREIEELGERMAAVESRKNPQTSGSRR